MNTSTEIERHPLQPFIPPCATLLMLGSFPPPRKRWSMDFFYPNMQNDMWRIMGYIFHNDREAFVDATHKRFDRTKIEDFLREKGIALYDTATAVRRLQGNASDKFLEIVEPTDLPRLLGKMPRCRAVVTTGQKATDIFRLSFSVEEPKVGSYKEFVYDGRPIRFYRMPSSSRAYPLRLEAKAEFYRRMLEEVLQ